jgi:hypothetical protein
LLEIAKKKLAIHKQKIKLIIMTHYRLSDSTPSAIILARNSRTSSLDELKTYTGNQIFLNNGDEFQIKLFNPLTEKIGVQVGFNGQSSKHLLVLNPGEDAIIDRFIDEKRRMIFETYQYDDNNKAAKKAVANNGIVEIRFFKEYIQPLNITTTSTSTYYNPSTVTIGNTTFNISGCSSSTTLGHSAGYSTLTNTCGMGGVNGPIGTQGTNGIVLDGTFTSFDCLNTNSRMYDQKSFDSVNLFNCNVSESSTLDFASDIELEQEQIKERGVKSKSLKKETGRIEKGKKSDQNFKQVEMQFQTQPFHLVTYYLKPVSEKDSYVHHEVREYCTKCSYRVRNNSWIFCPKCSNKL